MAITITSIRAGEAWSERNLSNGCLDEFRQDFSAESSHIEPIFHHVGTTVDLSIDLMTYTLRLYIMLRNINIKDNAFLITMIWIAY